MPDATAWRAAGAMRSVGQERGQPCPREDDSANERADMAVRAPFSRDSDRPFGSHPRAAASDPR